MIGWLLAIVYVEAMTEIIIESDIFFEVRNSLTRRNNYFGKLFSCGYCMSVWVSASIAWALDGVITGFVLFDFVVKLFVLHRLSNVLHELWRRWFDRVPFVMVINALLKREDKNVSEDPEGT